MIVIVNGKKLQQVSPQKAHRAFAEGKEVLAFPAGMNPTSPWIEPYSIQRRNKGLKWDRVHDVIAYYNWFGSKKLIYFLP